MKVILDTSVFVRDFRMDSPSFRTFLSQHVNVGHEFLMLEIVQDELLNKFREMLHEQKKNIDDGIREISLKSGRNLAAPLSNDDIVQMCDEYANLFNDKMKQSNATLLKYPEVPHKEVVARALQRKKPFDTAGQKGYRDALIWESILELIKQEPAKVAFISQNPRDFADNNGILHSVLREEISAFQNDDISVTYYPDLESFVSKEITPRLEVLEDLAVQLTGDGYKGFDLPTFTSSQLYKFIGTDEIEPSDLDLPRSFEALQIGFIEDVDEISNVAVYSLPGNDLLVDYESIVSISFTFLIDKVEYLGIPDALLEKIEVWDSDWNKYYQMCHIALDDVVIKIKLVLNQEDAAVKSAELVNISSEEWTWAD